MYVHDKEIGNRKKKKKERRIVIPFLPPSLCLFLPSSPSLSPAPGGSSIYLLRRRIFVRDWPIGRYLQFDSPNEREGGPKQDSVQDLFWAVWRRRLGGGEE